MFRLNAGQNVCPIRSVLHSKLASIPNAKILVVALVVSIRSVESSIINQSAVAHLDILAILSAAAESFLVSIQL